jgi:hypothetical protein
MDYELIFAKKGSNLKAEALDKILNRFDARAVEPHIWQFSSDKEFREIVFKISEFMGNGYKYFIVALDGSEDKHTPNEYWTNDDYIKFCADRLTKKGESGLHTLRHTSQVNFGRSARRLDSQ